MANNTRSERLAADKASHHLPRPGCAVIDAAIDTGLESHLFQRRCQSVHVFRIPGLSLIKESALRVCSNNNRLLNYWYIWCITFPTLVSISDHLYYFLP